MLFKNSMFIDVHCHLDLNKDIKEAVERARLANVEQIIVNGITSETNRKIIEMTGAYKEVRAAMGIYPIEALKMSDSEMNKEIEFIRKNAEKIVAIGEVGIDLKESEDLKNQIKNFKKFISLANELGKPVIVHTRKAEKECISVLKEMKAKKVVLHCFFGKMSLADEGRKEGWSFSIPTSVVHNEQMQKLVERVPSSQILCETDSPYMHPFRSGENEPALVVEGYKKIAEIKKISLEEFEKKVEENYKKLFD